MRLKKINSIFNRNELAIILGGKNYNELSYGIQKSTGRLTDRLKDIINFDVHYQLNPIQKVGKGFVMLDNGITFKSLKLSRAMTGCNEIISFIATIGPEIEKDIAILTKNGKISTAFILNSMGSLTVENMVAQFWENKKLKYQSQGRGVSLRFSPGYCDWPLNEQKKLFSLCDSNKMRVKINNFFLMSPCKSISGVFGISDHENASRVSNYLPCDECKKTDCKERRTRNNKPF
ncbi:AdoMet activation domain-containing protein [Candidatus Magnetomoraceae bacterium gMMP-15]